MVGTVATLIQVPRLSRPPDPMKKYLLLLLLGLVQSALAEGIDVFRTGLEAYQVNGPDALLRTWYGEGQDRARIDKVRGNLVNATADLGEVLATEVFLPKNLGKHIQRVYGVIYFRKRPVWIRGEYYSIAGQSGFISIEVSRNADDILPLEIGVAH